MFASLSQCWPIDWPIFWPVCQRQDQPLVTHWEGDTMAIDVKRKVPPGDKFYEWFRK